MLHFRPSKLVEQLLKTFYFNTSILFLLQLYTSTFCLATCRKLHLELCRMFALNLEDMCSENQLEIQSVSGLRLIKFLSSPYLKPSKCLVKLQQQKNRGASLRARNRDHILSLCQLDYSCKSYYLFYTSRDLLFSFLFLFFFSPLLDFILWISNSKCSQRLGVSKNSPVPALITKTKL